MRSPVAYLAALLVAGLTASLAAADQPNSSNPPQGNSCLPQGTDGCASASCPCEPCGFCGKLKAKIQECCAKLHGGGITLGNGAGNQKILAFPTHPFARSPRDYFMIGE